MHAGICRGIVDEHLPVVIGNPAIRESHVHHITQVLITLGNDEETTRLGNHLRRIVQGRHIHI